MGPGLIPRLPPVNRPDELHAGFLESGARGVDVVDLEAGNWTGAKVCVFLVGGPEDFNDAAGSLNATKSGSSWSRASPRTLWQKSLMSS
jgi:hypothetical protein